MYCRNCANPMDPNAAICVKCGVPAGQGTNYCPNCGAPTAPEATACTHCGVAIKKPLAPGEQKSKMTAGLLSIFLGCFGVGRFYLGYTTIGILQIVADLCFGAGAIWGLIEGILILCGKGITTDAKGNPLGD